VKLITAILRKEKLNDVLAQLFENDIHGVTVTKVRGHGGETEKVETYRGLTVKMELAEKIRLDIALTEPFVERTVDIILKAARTGAVGDGKVFVLPIEKAYRIRTGEEDAEAITPILAGV
jgi:nitrogen regulatory protein P-II 1